MNREYINPDNVYSSLEEGYSQAISVQGGRTIYTAGVVGCNHSGEYSQDFGEQCELAVKNLANILLASKASLPDIVRLDIMMIDLSDEKIGTFAEYFGASYGVGNLPPTAAVSGVVKLSSPDCLIEIQAVAVTHL